MGPTTTKNAKIGSKASCHHHSTTKKPPPGLPPPLPIPMLCREPSLRVGTDDELVQLDQCPAQWEGACPDCVLNVKGVPVQKLASTSRCRELDAVAHSKKAEQVQVLRLAEPVISRSILAKLFCFPRSSLDQSEREAARHKKLAEKQAKKESNEAERAAAKAANEEARRLKREAALAEVLAAFGAHGALRKHAREAENGRLPVSEAEERRRCPGCHGRPGGCMRCDPDGNLLDTWS